jgi:OmpA-OmpF porin, OOP family
LISKRKNVKTKIFFLTLCLFAISTLNAQNIYHPWIIGGGSNFTDFHFVKSDVTTQLQNANWMGKKVPSAIRIGRMVIPCLTISATYSAVTLEVDKLNTLPLREQIRNDHFWKAGLQAEFKFTNGKLLSESFFLDPYLYSGISFSSVNEKAYAGIPAGIGLNIWPLDYFGLNIQGSYEYVFDFDDYMHYSVGLVVRFGNMIDKDRDGIPDRNDACPRIWGIESMDGCPDYDHDGVPDSLDKCPAEYGWPGADGCPDFDKDGVADKLDKCPCEPGPKKWDGCPEPTTVTDPPEKYSVPAHSDKADQTLLIDPVITDMPEPARQQENNTPLKKNDEPEIMAESTPATIDEDIERHLENIRFNANSAAILPRSRQSLDEVFQLMNQHPDKEFFIQGYSDVSGSQEYNLFLSQERAKSVKSYLVEKGIEASRLEAKGFGEIDDVRSNDTAKGRAKNRRVEIWLK